MGDGFFQLAGAPVQVSAGVARTADGVLAGSVLAMDQAVRKSHRDDRLFPFRSIRQRIDRPGPAARRVRPWDHRRRYARRSYCVGRRPVGDHYDHRRGDLVRCRPARPGLALSLDSPLRLEFFLLLQGMNDPRDLWAAADRCATMGIRGRRERSSAVGIAERVEHEALTSASCRVRARGEVPQLTTRERRSRAAWRDAWGRLRDRRR